MVLRFFRTLHTVITQIPYQVLTLYKTNGKMCKVISQSLFLEKRQGAFIRTGAFIRINMIIIPCLGSEGICGLFALIQVFIQHT